MSSDLSRPRRFSATWRESEGLAGEEVFDAGSERREAGEQEIFSVERRLSPAGYEHPSSGRVDQGRAGRDIPLVLGDQGPGRVGQARGDQTHLESYGSHGPKLPAALLVLGPLAAPDLAPAGEHDRVFRGVGAARSNRGAVEGDAGL